MPTDPKPGKPYKSPYPAPKPVGKKSMRPMGQLGDTASPRKATSNLYATFIAQRKKAGTKGY